MNVIRYLDANLDAYKQVKLKVLEDLRQNGWQEETGRVSICLEEAVKNAVIHGNKFKGQVVLEYLLIENELAVIVLDEGKGFNLNEIPDPTSDENLRKPTGRGIMLMKHYADKVIYSKEGNCVMMKFKKR